MKPRKQLEISLTGPAIVERFRGTALDFFSSAGSHSASASSCLSSRLFSVFFPVVLNGFAVFQSGSPRQFCISVFAKDCHRILGQFSISLFFVNRPPPSCLRLPFSLLFLCFITLFHRVSLAISPKKNTVISRLAGSRVVRYLPAFPLELGKIRYTLFGHGGGVPTVCIWVSQFSILLHLEDPTRQVRLTLNFALRLPELLQLGEVLVQDEDFGEADGGHGIASTSGRGYLFIVSFFLLFR